MMCHSSWVTLPLYIYILYILYIYEREREREREREKKTDRQTDMIFNPVNLELRKIPSRTNKILKNRTLNLSNPGQELNVKKIHRANIFLFKKKKNLM